MANDLMTIDRTHAAFMPVLDMEQAAVRYKALVDFVESIMREGVDYGTIPGTDKPTLYKPGAEKLCTLFGLSTRFVLEDRVEDWMGKEHDGEMFFYYRYKCQLSRGDLLIAEAVGSCNSWESKYRYRNASRLCPACGEATIIKGREEYGGGWLCWRKKGGCGAKYGDGDPLIEDQEAGKVPNEDIASIVNTFQKMSQKRAFVAATLLAVNASEYFTQDLEDYADRMDTVDATFRPAPVEVETAAAADNTPPARIRESQKDALNGDGKGFYGKAWPQKRKELIASVTKGRTEHIDGLTQGEADTLIKGIRAKADEARKEVQAA